jgi:hypothetical protein
MATYILSNYSCCVVGIATVQLVFILNWIVLIYKNKTYLCVCYCTSWPIKSACTLHLHQYPFSCWPSLYLQVNKECPQLIHIFLTPSLNTLCLMTLQSFSMHQLLHCDFCAKGRPHSKCQALVYINQACQTNKKKKVCRPNLKSNLTCRATTYNVTFHHCSSTANF